jgi:ribosome biogenesis GTPase A
MSINWYPGHMKKTKELIIDNLKLVDIVIELLDARVPVSSKNPQIDEMIGNKQKVVVLNKFDLADQDSVDGWIRYFRKKGIKAIPINALTGEGINRLIHEIKSTAQPIMDKLIQKGRTERPIRVMIVGIPNVGKSSLINKLVGQNSAKTGDKPGVTRGKQWIRIKKGLELFDTPGILWPKIEDKHVGVHLAFIGSINDDILNLEEISISLIDFLKSKYPEELKNRYKLADIDKISQEILRDIGLKRGCLIKGGEVDTHNASVILLDEFREGRIGLISIESVSNDEIEND